MFNLKKLKEMRKLLLVASVFAVGLLYSCGPIEEAEPQKRNELVMDNSSYTINYATVYDQGTDLSEDPPLRKYQMTFASSQTLTASKLQFTLYSADTERINDGTYIYGKYAAGSFKWVYIDYALQYGSDGVAIKGNKYNWFDDIDSDKQSTIKISTVGNDKEYEFEICLEDGDTLKGYYKGGLESLN